MSPCPLEILANTDVQPPTVVDAASRVRVFERPVEVYSDCCAVVRPDDMIPLVDIDIGTGARLVSI